MHTVEVLHHVSLTSDLSRPVVTCPERKLNYRFMAREALWVREGRDDLDYLAEVNPRMADFSDDGWTLAGAYGPRIRPQVPYVVRCLLRDRDTRQAAMMVWTPCPTQSKDIPCTVAMVFSIREDLLYQHVFMRSSDAWLGIPYDVFTFSLLGIEIACRYNRERLASGRLTSVGLGHLTITCTSSHLYEENFAAAIAVRVGHPPEYEDGPPPEAPDEFIRAGDFDYFTRRVRACADREKGAEPRFPL